MCRHRHRYKYRRRRTPARFLPPGRCLISAKILIVDDQELVRRNLHGLLESQSGWDVFDVESGASALKVIRDIQPDVVVLDLVMPEMNGIELAYEIRRLDDAPKIILISSHYTPEEAAVLARLFGDGNFIPKSEVGEKLIFAIRALLPAKYQASKTAAQ